MWCVMEKEIICFENFNLPIKISRLNMKESDEYRGMHSHMAVEIVEVKSGILNCCVNDDVIELHTKQIIFINSNTSHKLYSENAEVIYYQVDISLLQENVNDDNLSNFYSFVLRTQVKPYLIFNDQNEITGLLNRINIKYYENSKESYWHVKAYLYELVAFMYSQNFIVPLAMPKDQFKKIEQVVYYIDTNFKSPIALDEICSFVKYNKYTICHMFKEVTGSTIFEYINFSRAHHAVKKLKETENSILEIATDCGFSSPTYFNRVFKRFFGCSPSVYRKLLFESKSN